MKEITQHSYSTVQIEEVNRRAEADAARFVQECEQDYRDQIQRIAQRIVEDIHQNQVVLLSGPTASAKTTTAHKLKEALGQKGTPAQVISLDDFYKNRDSIPLLPNGNRDLENVTALDLECLGNCFSQLFREGEAMFPIYDFLVSRRSTQTKRVSISGQILIVEGIHALNPQVAEQMDQQRLLRLYVSVRTKFLSGEEDGLIPKCVRLIRRMVRDQKFRSTPPEETLQMWETVCMGEREYINPFRDLADVKIDSTLEYEPCVFHHFLDPLLQKVPANHPSCQTLSTVYRSLSHFQKLPAEVIPADSILREFIG